MMHTTFTKLSVISSKDSKGNPQKSFSQAGILYGSHVEKLADASNRTSIQEEYGFDRSTKIFTFYTRENVENNTYLEANLVTYHVFDVSEIRGITTVLMTEVRM
ncbi:hypothetical protein FZC84_21245 [Rossellomorea vietnamensis]|uniref:Uncharacterized protein n=1 Tax=Rossellomorea vietnamensis TaxID=218284 RepID=A0A5D4M3U2_9BACI|nr:hypothetical protein [Rossellomorea vietnamensis]TYR95720.1 hypothetical protein FZC84_21245 [Rossellomorea vietnamensis]